MMGQLTSKQRQTLIDIVTSVILHDAYGLKRVVLQVAQPQGEVDHGAILEMCEQMCGQFTGADFGDFDLGDLMGTIIGGLNEENYKIDPFITNLSRGVIAVEGTVKTLSPNVNILNFFTSKVNTGLNFKLDLEHPEAMNPDIALKLFQLAQAVTDSSSKTAGALDMLEKGQIKVRTDLGFEDKALSAVSRLTGYAVRGIIIAALLVGSALLCTTSGFTAESTAVTYVFRGIGIVGFGIGLFFAQRLVRNMKKGK